MKTLSCFIAVAKSIRNIILRKYKTFLVVYLIIFLNCSIWLWLHINFEHSFLMKAVENNLEMNLKYDKNTGCDIPKLDPFASEIMQFDKKPYPRKCFGKDWVRCYMSRCKVDSSIYQNATNISCTFKDIIYDTDQNYHYGPPIVRKGKQEYLLLNSDHVFITCTAIEKRKRQSSSNLIWTGVATGFRKSWQPKPTAPCRGDTINVLMLIFESASKNGFIRQMPISYSYLTGELQATILNGYNIVGDDTEAALFPILTGKTELELPEARKSRKPNAYLDNRYFIFDKLTEDGYRTAYFEDLKTFHKKFNGFERQPADHYLRPLFMEAERIQGKESHCVGDTPTYELLLNLTDQIPQSRSCSEAGIEPHWCTCMRLHDLQPDDALFVQSAQALVDYINEATKQLRHLCVERELSSIKRVVVKSYNKKLLEYEGSIDDAAYYAKFSSALEYHTHILQVEITVEPGEGEFEAKMTYANGKFHINAKEVYRSNRYGDEPSCLNDTLAHLNIFCFCEFKYDMLDVDTRY